MKDLDTLFDHLLGDMICAERLILATLPAIAAKASDDDLRAALEQLRRDTAEQLDELCAIADGLGIEDRRGGCRAVGAVLAEAGEIIMLSEKSETRDTGLIASMQTLVHYEIARYGTLVAWARELGRAQIAERLHRNLTQHYDADAKLSKLGTGALNEEAA